MPYQVTDLSKHPKPVAGNYFFDTNVLLYVMGVSSNQQYESNYINFFNDVFTISITSKSSRILTTSLQISELFNRLLKLESRKAFIKTGYSKGEYNFYKEVFRKGDDITKTYQQFKSDFLAYRDGFDLIPCPVLTIDKILDYSPNKTDINDNLYVELTKSQKATIVTHDGDLFVEDLPILTMNNKLIAASRNFTVTPVKTT